MIADTGLQHLADQVAEQSQAAMSHLAVGDNNVAANPADTILGNELARVALTSVTRTDKKAVYVATLGPGVGTGGLQEYGIFNAASAGVLLARNVFSIINKGANDSMTITMELTFARA